MSEFRESHFILDFAEEADELLGRLGRHLLQLDQPEPEPQRAARLAEMLRELHTLKGLCGMVGLEGSAELAHLLESALGRVRAGRLQVTPGVIDRLLAATRKLTEAVAGSSTGANEPDSTAQAAALNELLAEGPESSLGLPPELEGHLGPTEQAMLAEGQAAGRAVGVAWFVPSAELVEEGWNVSRVRAQLEAFGQLVKAVPLVSGASVRFAFVLLHPPGERPEDCPGLEWSSPEAAPPPPPPPPPEPDEPAALARPVSPTVRVEVTRLDEIMRLVGDLIVSRWTLQATVKDGARDVLARMERQLRDLRRVVTRARMVPLGETFQRMPLVVRELARSSGREVQLSTSGEETQIDKVLVERLVDPLLHLVRNAVAHGLESPAERLAAGKPEVGRLSLAARPDGDSIVITVEDDGRGLDLQKIARVAGLSAPPTPEQALDLISRPGFSTRSQAGLDAGRGVGLDVVRRALQEIGATLAVASRAGHGCTFSLRVPLTLAIIEAFLLRVGNERYAVSRDAVDEVLAAQDAEFISSPRGELAAWRGATLPVVRLRELLHTPGAAPTGMVGLVHRSGSRRVVFLVDAILGLREVVVRPLVDPLLARPWLAGATELGDGGIALILDLPHLTELAARPRRAVPA